MKIIQLEIANFKRIVAVEIRPDGNLVEIGGRNGAGKSSCLDAILAVLGGGRNIPMVPIRQGAEQGIIKLDTGDLKVTRTFSLKEDGKAGEFTTTLKVETADGKRQPSPQDILNTLVGELSFDPLDFERMKAEDQFDTLKHLVSGYDFDVEEAKDAEDREERAALNRKAKELRAQAEGITLPAGQLPKRVDVAALEKQLGEAADHNALLERRKAKREAAQNNIDRMEERLVALRTEIAGVESAIKAAKDELTSAEVLPDPIDVSAVQSALGNARQSNAVADRADQRKKLNADAQAAEDASKAITARMDEREAAKQRAIAAAKMPVKGLGFGPGFVTLDGLPFAQASQAQRLRASLGIAVALNPKLRVVRITDGSRLDEDALKDVAAFAEQNDFQVWLERPGNGPNGFIIENGYLQGEAPVEEEEEAV